jgi:hypothetical protein
MHRDLLLAPLMEPTKSVETNRRLTFPLNVRRQFGSASDYDLTQPKSIPC